MTCRENAVFVLTISLNLIQRIMLFMIHCTNILSEKQPKTYRNVLSTNAIVKPKKKELMGGA